jgi:hypothetical protein
MYSGQVAGLDPGEREFDHFAEPLPNPNARPVSKELETWEPPASGPKWEMREPGLFFMVNTCNGDRLGFRIDRLEAERLWRHLSDQLATTGRFNNGTVG